MNGILVIGFFVVILALTIIWLQERQAKQDAPNNEKVPITDLSVVKARDWPVKERHEPKTDPDITKPKEEVYLVEEPLVQPVEENASEAEPVNGKDIGHLSGIGPKYRALLREAGISTISQIADSNPEELLNLLKETNEIAQITKRAPLLYNVELWIDAAKTQLT